MKKKIINKNNFLIVKDYIIRKERIIAIWWHENYIYFSVGEGKSGNSISMSWLDSGKKIFNDIKEILLEDEKEE